MYNDIADIYDEIFPLNQAFLNFLPAYLLETGSTVLDLGCGPGDYVGELENTGHTATGIDYSTGMIELAKSRNPGNFYPYGFADIYKLTGEFDCIYCVGNSLSYLSTVAVPNFLEQVQRLLTPGGNFIIQVVNWDRYRRVGASNFDVKELNDGRTFHRRYKPGENDTIIFHTAVQDGETVQNAWADTLYPKYMDKLSTALTAAGINVTAQLGDYAKAPFDPQNSPALIVVAKKN
jgi:SAM-dependent methyltransferase